MRRFFTTSCLLLVIVGCASAPSSNAFRNLSEREIAALQRSLASNLGAGGAVNFRWGPVTTSAPQGAHVGYCAEIDARNPDGARSGYRRFFALLIPDASGALTSGTIQAVAANSSAGDPTATRRVAASCQHWGYAP